MPKIVYTHKLHRPKPESGAKVSFSRRVIPKDAYVFLALGIACLVTLLVLTVIATGNDGTSSIISGVMGFAAFLVSIIGVAASGKMMMDDHNFYQMPILSMIVNGIALVLYILIYGYGLALMVIK